MKCGCYILFLKDFCLLFSKLQEKNVTLRQNDMITKMVRANEKDKRSKRSISNQEKERAIALIAYEDISDGGGVYNN